MVTAPDIPGHRVGAVLGSGGFATVYRSWQIEVLPPTEAAYDSGTRTYRCVASVTGSQPTISQFRR